MSATPTEFPHGLVFHRFHRDGELPTGQGSLSALEFERIIHDVGPSNILTPEEWRWRLRQGALRASDRCITFDDGLASQYDVALPVLEAFGLTAFWFVYSTAVAGEVDCYELASFFAARRFASFDEFVAEFLEQCGPDARARLSGPAFDDFSRKLLARAPFYSRSDLEFRFVRNVMFTRAEFAAAIDAMLARRGIVAPEFAAGLWMNEDKLRTLFANGHVVGLHSFSHPLELADLPADVQRAEYTQNRDHLSRVVGANIWSASHPLNSYNEATLRLLSQLGIECAFRDVMDAPPGKDVNANGLELARRNGAELAARTAVPNSGTIRP